MRRATGRSKHARRDGIASLVRAMQCAGGIPCHSGESGIWNDPRNLQGSLGEILLMHPVRPRRRSRRDQPNDRTSVIAWRPVFSFSSCVRYLLCYLLSSRPSAVRNVCDCVSVPPSPRGMSLFRNSATTSTNAPSAWSLAVRRRRIGSSISLPPRPSRERERFIRI